MATLTTTQPASTSLPRRLIIRHPLVAFFALAYAFSWLITLPLLLGTNGLGLFAYTVQAHDGPGFRLGADGRLAHAEPHLRALAAAAGFKVVLCEEASTRQDRGEDVPGLVLVLA